MPPKAPLARRLARQILDPGFKPPAAAVEKLKICLLDFFACALEARDLPWSRQAAGLGGPGPGPGPYRRDGAAHDGLQAAFANAVAGHGLVREDMHAGSVSHLGVVVLPSLLAVSESRKIAGPAFVAAAVVGYEMGAKFGRALVTPGFAPVPAHRLHRPAGRGRGRQPSARPVGSRLCQRPGAGRQYRRPGLNQWPHSGGAEMFFHPGFAARNALTAVELAAAGGRCGRRCAGRRGGALRGLPAGLPGARHPALRRGGARAARGL
jgi:Uncharacterized protein involved in propionate catabolism